MRTFRQAEIKLEVNQEVFHLTALSVVPRLTTRFGFCFFTTSSQTSHFPWSLLEAVFPLLKMLNLLHAANKPFLACFLFLLSFFSSPFHSPLLCFYFLAGFEFYI